MRRGNGILGKSNSFYKDKKLGKKYSIFGKLGLEGALCLLVGWLKAKLE